MALRFAGLRRGGVGAIAGVVAAGVVATAAAPAASALPGSRDPRAAVHTLSTTTQTVPATVVHDAAYAALYFGQVDASSRVVTTLLQSVASATFRTNPAASATTVTAELNQLRTALLGSDPDLRRFGPTTEVQLARALPILVPAAGTAPVTGPARAAVAAYVYRSYLAGSASGYTDDRDRFAGRATANAATRGSAGTAFAEVETHMLDEALDTARTSAASATVTDTLLQPVVGQSVKASAATLAAVPLAARAFADTGVTLATDGTGTASAAGAVAAALDQTARTAAATSLATAEVKALDAQQTTLQKQATDGASQQASQAAATSWLDSQKETAKRIQAGADAARPVLKYLDPEAGNQIATVVKSAAQVYENVLTIVDTVSKAGTIISGLTSAATFAATGNIIGAVAAVIGLFSGGGAKPDPVFEATKQIKQQIADLAKDMSARFDKVDKQLNTMMTKLDAGFASLDLQNKQIIGDVTVSLQQLAAAGAGINRLDQRVTDMFADDIRSALQGLIDHYLGYADRYGHPMSDAEFAAAESGLYTAATTEAAKTAVAGPLDGPTSNESLADELPKYSLDRARYHLGVLNRRFPADVPTPPTSTLVNPDDWAVAAQAYRQLLDENPAQALAVPAARLDAITSRGTAVRTALAPLRAVSGGVAPAIRDVTANYLTASTQLQLALQAEETAYRNATFNGVDPFGGPEQPLASIEPLNGDSMPNCTASNRGLTPSMGTADALRQFAPAGFLVRRALGAMSRQARVCWQQLSDNDDEQCRRVKYEILCTTTADFGMAVRLQELDGSTWRDLATLTKWFGNHVVCQDYVDGTTECHDLWDYTGWGTPGRDSFLATATRSYDDGLVADDRAGAAAALRAKTGGMYAMLSTKIANAQLRVPASCGDRPCPDAGQDAAKALSGAFLLLRSTVELAAPQAVTGDEFVRAALYGGEQLASNATTDFTSNGPLRKRLDAAAADPAGSDGAAWKDWMAGGRTLATLLSDRVTGYLVNGGQAQEQTLIPATLARLTAGDTLLRAASWTAKPTTVSAGTRAVGTTTTYTITVRNTGLGRPITVGAAPGSASITGTAPGDWTVKAKTCGTALAPLASCTLTVAFAPKATGARPAQLKLAVTPTGTGPVAIALNGTGSAP